MEEINLKPIGVVKNSEKEPRFGSFSGVVSEIIVDEKFTDALNGIERARDLNNDGTVNILDVCMLLEGSRINKR